MRALRLTARVRHALLQNCDGLGPTITVIKLATTPSRVVGGYLGRSWSSPSSGHGIPDRSAFLFKLTADGVYGVPVMIPVKATQAHEAGFASSSYGPSFGQSNSEFSISSNMASLSCSQLGTKYVDGLCDKICLCGGNTASISKVEVWAAPPYLNEARG